MFVNLFWTIILVMVKGEGQHAKRVLGIFMSVSFLLYFCHAIYFQQNAKSYLYIDALYNFCTLSVYPLFLIYIKSLTETKRKRHTNLILLCPALLIFVAMSVVYALMSVDERSSYISHFIFNHHLTDIDKTPLITIQTTIYFIARFFFIFIVAYVLFRGNQHIRRYNKKVLDTYSDSEQKTIDWANRLLNAFVITSIASIAFNFIGRSVFLHSNILLAIPSLIFSTLLFLIGHLGFHQNYDISNLEISKPEMITTTPVTEKIKSELQSQLNILFSEHKIYHKSDLKITDLASMLHTNRTYISNIINNEYQCSFNEYVNRFRIQEAKEIIREHPKELFENIASQVGYRSSSTFFRSFKQIEGSTPNSFKQQFRNQ